MEERRRSPRRAVQGELASVADLLNVRVLDISVAGVLLHSSDAVKPGAQGRLRLNLGGAAFSADVQVQRVARGSDAKGGYRLGATFVSLARDDRQVIERFIAQ